MPFIFCVIALARTLILCWIKVMTVDILVLFLILQGKLSAFHHWLWCYLWVCRVWSFLYWGMFPLYPFFESYHKWMLNFSNGFRASIERIMWFLSFILLMWCIMLIHLQCWTILTFWNKTLIVVCNAFNILLSSVW